MVHTNPMDADTAEALAYRLQSMLRERVSIDGEMLTRTVSIGVALGIPGQDTTSDLLRRADQAVLAAKSDGGNKVALFTDDMSLKSEFRNDIELHLQSVIENGALLLHYLPEIDMRTGQILACEALVRWQHPTRGLLSPDLFIGVAESINLAGELGRWVMRSACAEFAGWRSRGVGKDIVLRVNVSPVQLVTDGFVESVASIMSEFDLERGSVCLEITESVVVQDIETTRVTLAGLKAVGVLVAIDDFGTGYSALSQLKSLPVDTLKIDKGFVRELGTDPGDLAIVRAIIALAEAFGLELVAEGVETDVAALTLLRHGCHRAQGFLLSRPTRRSGDGIAVGQGAHSPAFLGLTTPLAARRVRCQQLDAPEPAGRLTHQRQPQHAAGRRGWERHPAVRRSCSANQDSMPGAHRERAVRRGEHGPDHLTLLEHEMLEPHHRFEVHTTNVCFCAQPLEYRAGDVVRGRSHRPDFGCLDRDAVRGLQRSGIPVGDPGVQEARRRGNAPSRPIPQLRSHERGDAPPRGGGGGHDQPDGYFAFRLRECPDIET